MTRAFNTRLVILTQGALLLIEAVFMALAFVVSWWNNDYDEGAFLVSTVLTAIAGFICLAIGHDAPRQVGEREGYVIVASVWLVFSAFGMLPYYLSGQIPTITDAWFETMSGFTTTGATIVTDIERMTHGALFWRSLTQWLGGMGIIVLSIAILPMFGLGGMQLYAAEVTGLQYEKLSPRIADTAKHLWITYIILTLAEAALLYTEGMTLFDAICHSLTTVATGGFSTKNIGIAYYANPAIPYTIVLFIPRQAATPPARRGNTLVPGRCGFRNTGADHRSDGSTHARIARCEHTGYTEVHRTQFPRRPLYHRYHHDIYGVQLR